MLSLRSNLYFPQIVKIPDVRMVKRIYPDSKSGEPRGVVETVERKKVSAYQLNWDLFDTRLEKKHNDWSSRYHPDKDIPWVPSLPTEYEERVRKVKFVIPHEYMTEIRRTSQAGLFEWNVRRSFDTCIRERCLKPAISFIQCAFMLLADCLYDEETQYYGRGPKSMIIKHVMSWKFWMHQTGRGCVPRHSGIDELERSIEIGQENKAPRQTEFVEESQKWISATKEHRKVIDKAYEALFDEVVPHECGEIK